jgi:MerR family transcriptional regulator, redox-sensitive transcriptional activator SoxR
MQTFGVGEIARRAGVAVSTIHYYERIGLLPPSQRVNGKRRYELTILKKLALVRLGQQAGLRIAEIQMLVHDFPADTPPAERWQSIAPQKIRELDELLLEIQARKALLEQTQACRCSSLDDCASLKIDGLFNTLNACERV